MICVFLNLVSMFGLAFQQAQSLLFALLQFNYGHMKKMLITTTIEQQRLYVSIDIFNHKYIYLHMKETTIEAGFRHFILGLGFGT